MHYGWVDQDDFEKWEAPDNNLGCLNVFDARDGIGSTVFQPCLFDLVLDQAEREPLDLPRKVNELWKLLNDTIVYQYNQNLVGKELGVSPAACLGECKSAREATSFRGRGGRRALVIK